MKLKYLLTVLSAASLLVACGGGGADAGISPFGTGSGAGSTGSTGSGVTSNTAGTLVLSLSSTQISSSLPGTVTAALKDASGNPVVGALVSFGVSGGTPNIAQASPSAAITNSSGQASTTLTPTSGATSGAANVTASATTSAGALSTQTGFSVSASNVTLDAVTVGDASINGYGSTSVNFTVSAASSSNPVTVNLSSTCASSNKATISPSSLTLTSTTGSVTYQDRACAATDRINVQIAGTSQQRSVDLSVAAPGTQGIQYFDTDRNPICLIGTGCASVAVVTFKVVDSSGAGKSGVLVDFSLDPSVSGFADLGASFGTTGVDGKVSVSVASKKTPTPLRVTATVRGVSPVMQTVSNLLTISGGLPVAGTDSSRTGISFASEKSALDGNLDGDKADLTLRLTDQWGAPAINGTAVSLVSDGGTVVPAYCTTLDGKCTVKLVVSNPRPANGRVHVMAYAKGQEFFVDVNSSSEYNLGDTYDDVPMGVCLDKNENNACDGGEFIIGSNSSPDLGNGVWDGNGTAYARLQRLFFFSNTAIAPRLYKVSSGVCTNSVVDDPYMTVTMGTSNRKFIEFCVRDANSGGDAMSGNPIASGSILAAKATINSVTVAVDNSPIPDMLSGPTRHVLTIANPLSPTALTVGGKVDISFTMGADGATRKFTILDAVTVNP